MTRDTGLLLEELIRKLDDSLEEIRERKTYSTPKFVFGLMSLTATTIGISAAAIAFIVWLERDFRNMEKNDDMHGFTKHHMSLWCDKFEMLNEGSNCPSPYGLDKKLP